jgi:hypothetical protein
MSDSIIAQFAALLSREDDAGRARLMAQAKLLSMQEAPAEAFEPPIRTLGQYLADEIPVPPVLVEPFIVVRGGLTCTIGRAGKGKTVMNLNRILKWSAGKPMFDGWKDADGASMLAPAQPLKVLVIENEGAGGLFHRQIGIMVNSSEFMDDEARKLAQENVLIWGDGGYSNLKLDDPVKLGYVREGIEKFEPDVVFVEPFRGLWSGEENSATDMAVVVDNLVAMAAEYKIGVMLAHHERKSGVGDDGEKMSAGRGSTVLEGAVTVMENFESVKGGDFRELTWSKSRHGKAPNPVRMEWVPDQWWYQWVPQGQIEEAILSALRESPDALTVAQLQEMTDEKAAKLRPMLQKMVKDNKIKRGKSHSDGTGSTGATYRLSSEDTEDFGGLGI